MSERTLVLVRHAKAEQGSIDGTDHGRALADRGRHDAEVGGAWLREQGVAPDLVLCSSARRTRQTLDALVRGGLSVGTVRHLDELYEAGLFAMLEAIRTGGDAGTVLVIGHAPTIPGLSASLCDVTHDFPTCGTSVLDVDVEWADLGAGGATLRAYEVPRA